MDMDQNHPVVVGAGFIARLQQIAGSENVETSPEALTFYSTDIAGRAETAEAVVRIGDVQTLQAVVRACAEAGRGVVPRGGGFSYTGGYTPTTPGSVIVDLRPMDRVVEINERDMYVVVEAGCTWRNLYEALKAKGLRTPYFGPMSGFGATVGGALSQGSFFLGSTQYGAVSDSVLGLELVLADGNVLRTGSGASREGASPFMRQYGPDATGLFLNDNGAMGFKTRAVLRLIPFPSRQGYASFAFKDYASALKAVSAVGRTGLAGECYCWDPYFVRVMAATGSTGFRQDAKLLLNVVRSGANLIDGLAAAARIALAGRGVFKGDTWLLHLTVDDVSARAVADKLAILRGLARKEGGAEVSPTAPRTMRGTPFIEFNTAERRRPLRNLPVNSLSPHSRVGAVADEVYAFLADNKAAMDEAGVMCGVIFLAVGAQAVCVEPLIYWDDPEAFLHDRVKQRSDLVGLAAFAERPPATVLAMQLRHKLKAIFRRHGCAHVQIGRAYPWAETRDEATLDLMKAVKSHVDPERLINAGSLGLDTI
jgi:D-lactate dehydrogenase (cytochrome)